MVRLEVYVLVCVSLLSLHCCGQSAIRVVGDQGVKKGEFPILLRLHSELNVGSMKLRWEVNVGIWSEGRAVHLSST